MFHRRCHHRHRDTSKSWRLLLAKLGDDHHAADLLVHETQLCAKCWFVVAWALADLLVDDLRAQLDEGRFVVAGMDRERLLDYIAHRIATELDRDETDA